LGLAVAGEEDEVVPLGRLPIMEFTMEEARISFLVNHDVVGKMRGMENGEFLSF
jgi:hypothetical protein